MELKKTNHLLSSVDVNVVKPSERNNSDRRSIYDMFFTVEQDETDNSIDAKYSDFDNEEWRIGNVSTLDWLQTWRSTEIS